MKGRKMKKLIVIMSVAMVALIAPAATVSWTMTNVYGPGGSLNSGTAYMFGYNDGDGISRSAIVSAIQSAFNASGAEGVENLLASHYNWTPSTAGTYTDSSKTVNPVTDFGLIAGVTYNIYAVIFDSNTLTADSKFFVSKEVTNKNVPTGSNNLSLLFGNMATASQAEGAWVPIPEPTSGLLMLLGMASLALKRKHV